ncbi:MAG: carbonic anhydrase [Verrucomicrobiia bacterium]|jgi:carbonic anhydrase
MRLLEAIIAANHAAAEGRKGEVHLHEFAEELPLAALTCIDPRLNRLFPGAVGLDEDDFIWLRNAGNVITSATSSTVRSMALSIFVKGAKEIAVIGHTDCKLSKFTMMDLLARLQEHGMDRSMINQANLHEFFGLFSSETQNVIKGVGCLRESPYIPKKMPVHGLIIQTDTGRLDWVVNGYEAPPQTNSPTPSPKSLTGAFESLLEKAEPLIPKKWEAPNDFGVGAEVSEHLPKQAPPPPVVNPAPAGMTAASSLNKRDKGPFR